MKDFLKNKSLLWGLIGLVVLAAGVIVAVQLIPQEQDTRREAAVQGGTVQVKIEPATLSVAPNEMKDATVSINTNNTKIKAVVVVLKFPTGTTSPITAQDITLKPPFNANPWTCTGHQVRVVNQEARIEVPCYNNAPGGFYNSNTAYVPLFSFKVKGGATTTQTVTVVTFDTTETVVSKFTEAGETNPGDIAAIPTSQMTVTVRAASTTSPTPSPSPTVSPSPSPAVSPTPTASPSVSPTPTPSGYVEPDKRILLSLSGVSCTAAQFSVTATVKENESVKQDINVTFTYDNQEKTAYTNSSGQASVSFNKASTDKTLTAKATDYRDGTIDVDLPSNCSTSTVGAACNAACTSSRDCASGRSCISGLCRDSRCTSDATCQCGDTDPAAENGDDTLPTSGFDQTMAFTLLGLLFILGGGQLWWSLAHHTQEVTEERE